MDSKPVDMCSIRGIPLNRVLGEGGIESSISDVPVEQKEKHRAERRQLKRKIRFDD